MVVWMLTVTAVRGWMKEPEAVSLKQFDGNDSRTVQVKWMHAAGHYDSTGVTVVT